MNDPTVAYILGGVTIIVSLIWKQPWRPQADHCSKLKALEHRVLMLELAERIEQKSHGHESQDPE